MARVALVLPTEALDCSVQTVALPFLRRCTWISQFEPGPRLYAVLYPAPALSSLATYHFDRSPVRVAVRPSMSLGTPPARISWVSATFAGAGAAGPVVFGAVVFGAAPAGVFPAA